MRGTAALSKERQMPWFAILGVAVVAVILWDVFETIILPRRVTRRFRLARAFYRWTWRPWRMISCLIHKKNRRESFLSFYGPLSLLGLFVVWAAGLILGFAALHYAAGSALSFAQNESHGFLGDLYMSGTTFFTLGLGDVAPLNGPARVITVFEVAIGFGFLALVISYLPVLYGAFSRREVNISLLDARAGSPPSASEMLRRVAQREDSGPLEENLREWEKWSAELMESHLSYPVLCYFRSQHDNQSWLAAITTVLDVSAMLIAYGQGSLKWQAKLTFAISRHALVDLSQVLGTPPRNFDNERLSAVEFQQLCEMLTNAGMSRCSAGRVDENDQRFNDLRRMYEPYASALAERLLMPIGDWTPSARVTENWRTSAWARISTDLELSPLSEHDEKEHF
jgi:Ion channel